MGESVSKRKVTTSSDVSVLQDSKGSSAKKVTILIILLLQLKATSS